MSPVGFALVARALDCFDAVGRGCSNTFPVKLNWQQSLATVGANLRNVIRVTVAVACVEGILFELSNNPGDPMRPPFPSNTPSLQALTTPTHQKKGTRCCSAMVAALR